MSKTHLTVCLLATTLIVGPAIAQTSTAPKPASPPAATSSGSGANTTMGAGGSATMNTGSFITQREPGIFRASELIGMDVRGANNEDIGEVGDVLIDRSGQARAVVIDVGGFLGLGETHVAIPMQALQFGTNQQNASAAGMTGNAGNSAGSANPSTTGATGQNNAARNTQNQASANANNTMPDVIVLVMTKEQLQNAPKFQDNNRSAGNTTGSTGGNTGAGTTAPRQ